MAVDRVQARIVFERALRSVRGHRNSGGTTTLDPAALARDIYHENSAAWPNFTRRDAQFAVSRAVKANDAGRRMNQNPTERLQGKGSHLPNVPLVNLASGRYEYQVVLIVTGSTGQDEFLFRIPARKARTAQELDREARRLFRNDAAWRAAYATQIGALGNVQRFDSVVVSATYFWVEHTG